MTKILTEEELKEIIGFVEYDLEEGNNIFWGHAKILLEEIVRLKELEVSYLSANAELSFKNMLLKAAYNKLLKETNPCKTQSLYPSLNTEP